MAKASNLLAGTESALRPPPKTNTSQIIAEMRGELEEMSQRLRALDERLKALEDLADGRTS